MTTNINMSWQDLVFNPSMDTGVDAITATVELLFQDLRRGIVIDLTTVTPEIVSAEHLCAVLRVTFNIRDNVPGWKNAVHVASKALSFVDIDPQDALFGLIDYA